MAAIKSNYGRSTFVAWGSIALDLIDIDSGGITATTDIIDNTRYGDSVRRSLPGYTDYGSVAITVSTDRNTDVANLRRNFRDHVIGTFTVVLPTGLVLGYDGFISSFTHFLDKNGLYTLKLTIKLSSTPTEQTYPSYTIMPSNNSHMYKGSSYGLFLIPGANTANTGGEGAVWEITGNHHQNTAISGNTIYIAPEETQAQITVKATIYPTELAEQAATAVYNIDVPSATSVSITGPDTITYSKSQAQPTKTEQYISSVYPSGASSATRWVLKQVSGADPENGIAINAGTGLITITKADYLVGLGPHQYIVQAYAGVGVTISNLKYITVLVTA